MSFPPTNHFKKPALYSSKELALAVGLLNFTDGTTQSSSSDKSANGFCATKTVVTLIPSSAGVFTNVPFSDTSTSPFNNPGNNYSSPTFTVGAGAAGFYDIHATINWDTTGVVVNTVFQCRVILTGSTSPFLFGHKIQAPANVSINSSTLGVTQIQLSVGDTVTFQVSQDSGNNVNVLDGTFGMTHTSS